MRARYLALQLYGAWVVCPRHMWGGEEVGDTAGCIQEGGVRNVIPKVQGLSL